MDSFDQMVANAEQRHLAQLEAKQSIKESKKNNTSNNGNYRPDRGYPIQINNSER